MLSTHPARPADVWPGRAGEEMTWGGTERAQVLEPNLALIPFQSLTGQFEHSGSLSFHGSGQVWTSASSLVK